MNQREQEAIDELRARVQFQGNASLYATAAEAKEKTEEHAHLCLWFMHAHGQVILDLLAEIPDLRANDRRYRFWRASQVRPALFPGGDDGWTEADTDAAIDAGIAKAVAKVLR